MRLAIDDDRTGAALAKVLSGLRGKGWQVGGDQLKRTPKPWLHTAETTQVVRKAWKALGPLNDWLATNA